MAEQLLSHRFENGLTLVGQPMSPVVSAALTMAVPGGCARDPADAAGAAAIATDWMLRGAGQRDTRQLNESLDALGAQHDEEAHCAHLFFSAAQLGNNLPQVLELYADILRRPTLGDDTFTPCRELVLQALDGMEDEPMRQCNLLIRERFYPYPLGRNPLGSKQTISAVTAEGVRAHLRRTLVPAGAIMSIAGAFDWPQAVDLVGRLFGDWRGQELPPIQTSPPVGGIEFIKKDSAQAQIALAYPAAVFSDPRYYAARVTQMVLSGGMSARLFTEVREKRALVYSVAARYHSLKDYAGFFVYAGTAPQRAQETLDVTVGELRRLAQGVEEDELARARTQLKSVLVMQGESTSARADALVGDWYHLGRLTSLQEVSAAIDGVTRQNVMDYLAAYPADKLAALIIGPQELDTKVVAAQ